MAHRLHTFTVVGWGVFPVDMLRYDSAWPLDDAACFAIVERNPGKGVRRARLASHQEPTRARWESFGWQIVSR